MSPRGELFEEQNIPSTSSSSSIDMNPKLYDERAFDARPQVETNTSEKLKQQKKYINENSSHSTNASSFVDLATGSKQKNQKARIKSKQKSGKKRNLQRSRSGSSSSISASNINEIKDSLKDHFEAIKSLQNALSFSDLKNFGGSKVESVGIQSKIEKIEKKLHKMGKRFESLQKLSREPSLDQVGSNRDINTPSNVPHSIGNDSRSKKMEQENMKNVPVAKEYESKVAQIPTPISNLQQNRPNSEPVAATILLDRISHLEAKYDFQKNENEQLKKLIQQSNHNTEQMNERVSKAEKQLENLISNQLKNSSSNNTTKPSNNEALVLEIVKMKQDIKLQENQNLQLIERNYAIEQKLKSIGEYLQFHSSNKKGDTITSEGQVRDICRKFLNGEVEDLREKLSGKVDTCILEELAKHIATKEELKKYLKKSHIPKIIPRQQSEAPVNNAIQIQEQFETFMTRKINKLEEEVQEKLLEMQTNIFAATQTKPFVHTQPKVKSIDIEMSIKKQLKEWAASHIKKTIETTANLNLDYLKQSVADWVRQTQQKELAEQITQADIDMNPIVRQLTREFDEKLYVLCSEVSACKTMFSTQAQQPFYKCAQWIWNSGSLKLGSAVPWNIQSTNTDPDNFKWDQDNFNIRIAEAGLYEINLAFFTKSKPSIQLVVNGESVLSAINSPSYVVQHSSGYVIDGNGKMEHGTDFLTLPSKSTISIHYHGMKATVPVHGFLGFKRL